jgi:hypothetical protein
LGLGLSRIERSGEEKRERQEAERPDSAHGGCLSMPVDARLQKIVERSLLSPLGE